MFSIAKWIDTEYFPETKKAFFKERKNGEITVCYRGRCWSYLTSWCIFGRGDKYDLNKIFKFDERAKHTNFPSHTTKSEENFLHNAKKFIRSPDSEQYLNDALEVFNRFRGFAFDNFANPADFSDILQLGNYLVNEPLPVKPEDERLTDYYNAVFATGVYLERMSFKCFFRDKENYKHSANDIKTKDLIAHISHICELGSDWNEASRNLRPTFDYGYNSNRMVSRSKTSISIYLIAIALCNFKKEKPSHHFSRIYIDSIFNLKRDAKKTFEPKNMIDNFTLLQGEESSPFEEISKRFFACRKAFFMEPIPEHLLTLFSDTDSFLEKVDFLGSFFVKTHSFLGCIDQNMDVLSRLRTEGDKLGKLVLDVYCLAPRSNHDYENTVIDFITKNYTHFTLLEKFKIFNIFNHYHQKFDNYSILQLILTFFRNRSNITIDPDELQFSIHWIAECLKSAKMSKNLLANLNSENASFNAFLKHFLFSKNSLTLPLFAASTLPFDLDWNQINKILTSYIPFGTEFGLSKFGASKLVEDSENFVEASNSIEDSDSALLDSDQCNSLILFALKARSDDLFLNDFIANTAMEVTNENELLTLVFYIKIFKIMYTKELIETHWHNKPSSYLVTLIKNIKSFNEVAPHRIPHALQQIQALLNPFESQKMISGKTISDLIVRLAKIPKSYQPLTSTLIKKVRSAYLSIENSLFVNYLKVNYLDSVETEGELEQEKEQLPEEIHNTKLWTDSKVLTLLEAMHFGAIIGPRLNEDVLFLILEKLIALRAHEALQNDQIEAIISDNNS